MPNSINIEINESQRLITKRKPHANDADLNHLVLKLYIPSYDLRIGLHLVYFLSCVILGICFNEQTLSKYNILKYAPIYMYQLDEFTCTLHACVSSNLCMYSKYLLAYIT